MTRRIRFSAASAAAIAAFSLFACGSKDQARAAAGDAGAEEKPVVSVSILPQSYFAKRIAGERVTVLTLVGAGQSPHSYEPSPRQMVELAKASLWVTTGVEFENALKPKVAALYPKMRIADGTKGVALRKLDAHPHDEDGAEHKTETEGGPDPHVWLGKAGALAEAAVIRDELSSILPSAASEFASNYDAFAKEVDELYAGLASSLAPLKGKPVFVYHPAFGYLLDEFGLEQEAVETGGKEPTAKALSALIKRARDDGAKVVFVQTQFPVAAAKKVADAIGGAVVPIDDLAPDWAANIRRIGEALKAGVR